MHNPSLRALSTSWLSRLTEKQWLLSLCLFQLFFWTLGPWLVRQTLVYDTLEGIVWGNLWQWGYDKHPPLTPWLTVLFAKLGTDPDLPVYFLAQICVVITFLAVWRLAREFLSERGALLSTFLLLGVCYYSNRVERVTPDTLQSPVWALMVLSFYFALIEANVRKALKYWLATGVLAGLAILTKYQVAVLFSSMLLIMVSTDKGLNSWRTAGPWLAAIAAAVVTAPHLAWLIENNFVSISYLNSNYIDNPEVGLGRFTDHLLLPLQYLASVVCNFIPLVFLFWPLLKLGRTAPRNETFQLRFLTLIAVGPFALTLLFGMMTGEELIPRWSTPYFAWLPLWLLVILRIHIDDALFRKTAVICLLTGLFLWSLRIGYLYYKPYFSTDYWKADEFLPARQEMARAEALWHEHYPNSLPYLGGMHYHVTGLTAYSHGNTIPFLGLDPVQSGWMSEQDFRQRGGIIVIRHGNRQTKAVQTRLQSHYPQAEYLGTFATRPLIPKDIVNPRMSVVDFYLLRPEG